MKIILRIRKTTGTAENPAHKNYPFYISFNLFSEVHNKHSKCILFTSGKPTLCDNQINVKYYWQLYAQCTYVQPLSSDLDLNDLNDLSGSLKIKSDDIISIYGFLLMVSSNIGPNSAPL